MGLAEAEDLRNESYGSELLHHLGYIYENEARQHLRGFLGLSGMAAEVREKVHLFKEVIGAFESSVENHDARRTIAAHRDRRRTSSSGTINAKGIYCVHVARSAIRYRIGCA